MSFYFSFTFHVILAKRKAFKGKYINIETSRETREGWPLLTVETEVNGDSKRTKRVLPWLVFWDCRAGKQDFVLPWTLVGPVQNIFSLTVHYFNSIVAIAQQARQAAVLGPLPLSRCLWRQVVRSCVFIAQLLELY